VFLLSENTKNSNPGEEELSMKNARSPSRRVSSFSERNNAGSYMMVPGKGRVVDEFVKEIHFLYR
jgi:hypothetical protein